MRSKCDNCGGEIGVTGCGAADEKGARAYCCVPCYEKGEGRAPETYDNPILNERESSHGDFSTTAMIAQDLKSIVRGNSHKLDNRQAESLDLICTKIARLLSGDNNCKDTWDDIAGYANLIGERLGE